jgi:hypothetical protein
LIFLRCYFRQTLKVKKSYQDFLSLWKEADADIPVLIQARREYAKLAGTN